MIGRTNAGGGGGANFRVIEVSSQITLPAIASENTIAIQTTTSDSPYTMSAAKPFNPETGDIWIQLSEKSSIFAFNALSSNDLQVCPLFAWQYDGTDWAEKQMYVYQGGTWQPAAMKWQGGYEILGPKFLGEFYTGIPASSTWLENSVNPVSDGMLFTCKKVPTTETQYLSISFGNTMPLNLGDGKSFTMRMIVSQTFEGSPSNKWMFYPSVSQFSISAGLAIPMNETYDHEEFNSTFGTSSSNNGKYYLWVSNASSFGTPNGYAAYLTVHSIEFIVAE